MGRRRNPGVGGREGKMQKAERGGDDGSICVLGSWRLAFCSDWTRSSRTSVKPGWPSACREKPKKKVLAFDDNKVAEGTARAGGGEEEEDDKSAIVHNRVVVQRAGDGMDWVGPGQDGMAVCRRCRHRWAARIIRRRLRLRLRSRRAGCPNQQANTRAGTRGQSRTCFS